MSRKLIFALIAFFVLTAAGSYLIVNRKPSKVVDLTPSTTTQRRGAVTKEDANTFVLLGRFAEPLKVNDVGYLEGTFILEGDPNQTKLRVSLTPDDEGLLYITKYEDDFAGTAEVQRLKSEEVMVKVKEDTPALITVAFITTRPLKSFETYLKRNYEILASGSWNIERPESMVISTSTFGLIY